MSKKNEEIDLAGDDSNEEESDSGEPTMADLYKGNVVSAHTLPAMQQSPIYLAVYCPKTFSSIALLIHYTVFHASSMTGP